MPVWPGCWVIRTRHPRPSPIRPARAPRCPSLPGRSIPAANADCVRRTTGSALAGPARSGASRRCRRGRWCSFGASPARRMASSAKARARGSFFSPSAMLRYCGVTFTSMRACGNSAATERAMVCSTLGLLGQPRRLEIAQQDAQRHLGNAAFDAIGVQKALAVRRSSPAPALAAAADRGTARPGAPR